MSVGAVDAIAPLVGAVVVAWIGFRLAIRQDERRWSRERRAEVYIDALTEASAERDAIMRDLAITADRRRTRCPRISHPPVIEQS